MRQICFIIALLAVLFSSAASAPQTALLSDIQVDISNIQRVTGTMRVALFNKAEGFRNQDSAIRKELFPVTSQRLTYTFEDLKPGFYAVAVYHDEDNDGILDTNILTIPTEWYGFSNNQMGFFGPPSFDQASFVVPPGRKRIEIVLR
jgi:uncharacterized protein (DUF2141 family)